MFIWLSRLSSRNDNGDMIIRAEIQSIDGSLGNIPGVPCPYTALLLATRCSTDLEPETRYGSRVPSRWYENRTPRVPMQLILPITDYQSLTSPAPNLPLIASFCHRYENEGVPPSSRTPFRRKIFTCSLSFAEMEETQNSTI
jgi:hypothetical protein